MENNSIVSSESSNGIAASSSKNSKKHLVLEGMKMTNLDEQTESREHFFRYETLDNDKAFAATILTEVIMHELGDGDGENEGIESLANCRIDIWKSLYYKGQYSYADLMFRIDEIDFLN